MKDSEENDGRFFGVVTEGLNEGEEEGGKRILRERKEKFLREGERGRANGGAGVGNGAFESF